ncbi:M66 family metalloprotease [Arthrobacter sp. Bi26]|uniref:M66 family metalloprotease n=1 Tax=Arthrobacter sp. Bi26 TaxID=2822350 RepID=UPI001E4D9381|nr:M66 family metalloprotease [Arthrobacter sp. Bi26]
MVIDRFKLWSVRAVGIEVTQSIQHYKADQHLSDPSDRGADNSVHLVAGKTAWVRVYVRSGLISPINGVTGTLRVQRRILGFLWSTVATLNPLPPGNVQARSLLAYTTERGNVANTLNFAVPADNFWGNLRLTATLTSSSGQLHDTRTITVDATLRQTLRLRGILVSYNGPSTANTAPGQPPPPILNLAAPSVANLQATAARALRAMPVQSSGVFTSAGTLAWNRPLDDPRLNAGGCSTNWNLLLNALTNQRTNDGNRADVVYYGLLPTGIPLNVPGCGVGGLGAAGNGDQTTLLHEIGHGYGFQHTPCGAAGSTDPNYPVYEPYPSASIGEYGLDIANGNILPPASTSDYMSYCFPQWMSLYQHGRLIQHPRLDPRWDRDEPWVHDYLEWKNYIIPEYVPDPPPDPWRWALMRPERVISLTGIIHPDDRVEVLSVARVEAGTQLDGRTTGLVAYLRGSGGEVLAQAPIVRLTTYGGSGCGCGCDGDIGAVSYPFQALVPDAAPGEALTISHNDEELWVRRAGDQPPTVRQFDATVDDDGTVRMRWDAQAGEHPEFWIQWSDDRGRGWHAVSTGVTGNELELVPASLPVGEVQLRVLANDGFATATSQPVTVAIPERMPEIAVLHPIEGQSLIAGQAMQLSAAISGRRGDNAVGLIWLLDGKEAANINEAWIEAPRAGEHRITLLVRSEVGGGEESLTFTTIEVPQGAEGETDGV